MVWSGLRCLPFAYFFKFLNRLWELVRRCSAVPFLRFFHVRWTPDRVLGVVTHRKHGFR